MASSDTGKIIANNKKVFHDYYVEQKYEAGIELHGTEVKSIRQGKCSIKEAYISVSKNGELFIYNMNVTPYEKGNIFNKDPLRIKKLLLHKFEIRKLEASSREQGYTIMPLNVHLTRGKVKLDIGLCRGKKLYDKRKDIAKKDQDREARRDFKITNLK